MHKEAHVLHGAVVKLHVRNLPPAMPESAVEQALPATERGVVYKRFVQAVIGAHKASSSAQTHQHSRLIIALAHSHDAQRVVQALHDAVFVSKRGSRYTAIVELSLSQRVPKAAAARAKKGALLHEASTKAVDALEGTIEHDSDFTAFCNRIEEDENYVRPSAEQRLDEGCSSASSQVGTTGAHASASMSGVDGSEKTPLMQHVEKVHKHRKGGVPGRKAAPRSQGKDVGINEWARKQLMHQKLLGATEKAEHAVHHQATERKQEPNTPFAKHKLKKSTADLADTPSRTHQQQQQQQQQQSQLQQQHVNHKSKKPLVQYQPIEVESKTKQKKNSKPAKEHGSTSKYTVEGDTSPWRKAQSEKQFKQQPQVVTTTKSSKSHEHTPAATPSAHPDDASGSSAAGTNATEHGKSSKPMPKAQPQQRYRPVKHIEHHEQSEVQTPEQQSRKDSEQTGDKTIQQQQQQQQQQEQKVEQWGPSSEGLVVERAQRGRGNARKQGRGSAKGKGSAPAQAQWVPKENK